MTARYEAGRYAHDCAHCDALCCTAMPFSAGQGFAFDKARGETCRHLGPDNLCTIHDRLEDEGMPGCIAFTCWGAGQRVSALFRGSDAPPEAVFEKFHLFRTVHQMIAHILKGENATADGQLPLAAALLEDILTDPEGLPAGDSADLAEALAARIAARLSPGGGTR